MEPFSLHALRFHEYARRKLDNVENQMVREVQNEDDVDELESKLSSRVEQTKQDFNTQIDALQQQIKSKRPQPGDLNYAQKKEQYVQFLATAVDGVDLIRASLRQVFDRLKKIVMSVVDWIKRRITGVINFIRDGFRALRSLFS